MKLRFSGIVVTMLLMMTGCASVAPPERDAGPSRPVDLSNVPDAQPRFEPRTIAGNKNPYTVLGNTYHLLADETGYKERGEASWYGTKFHGRKTSNGETYDMYAMTAAHKTLPIPSYVRVTNLDNGRNVVVRVNDRGPFHGGRIIDLSYAAAQRLGFASKGVAPVEVEIVVPDQPMPVAADDRDDDVPDQGVPNEDGEKGAFLQVGAFSTEAAARTQAQRVAELTDHAVVVSTANAGSTLYRVRVGPLTGAAQMRQVREQLHSGDITQIHIVSQ